VGKVFKLSTKDFINNLLTKIFVDKLHTKIFVDNLNIKKSKMILESVKHYIEINTIIN